MSEMSVSVVIPVYNSAVTLPALVRRLVLVLEALAEPFEIILVNDGSKDESWQTITRLCDEWPEVSGIDLMRNFGQHNALLCGIRVARNAVIVTMDDDLQNPPEETPHLLARLTDTIDVVYGTPQREQHGLWRNLASHLTKRALQQSLGATVARSISAFRAFRTSLRTAFADYQGPDVSVDVLLSWSTTRFAAVPVQHAPRRAGDSNYTLPRLVAHALNLITGFSTRPLQVSSMLGFAFTFIGLASILYVLGRYIIQGDPAPGFPFLASIISIFAGVQLFSLGVIGEYLGRIHIRLLHRPTYAVRSHYSGTRFDVLDEWHAEHLSATQIDPGVRRMDNE
jgi:glycosyltransferase involved in cell wall biosynthesis